MLSILRFSRRQLLLGLTAKQHPAIPILLRPYVTRWRAPAPFIITNKQQPPLKLKSDSNTKVIRFNWKKKQLMFLPYRDEILGVIWDAMFNFDEDDEDNWPWVEDNDDGPIIRSEWTSDMEKEGFHQKIHYKVVKFPEGILHIERSVLEEYTTVNGPKYDESEKLEAQETV
ncbi:hypothetical protein RUND412_002431 [Rhizina undulata]